MNSLFLPIFENMPSVNPEIKSLETLSFPSKNLERNLRIDFYLPPQPKEPNRSVDVLVINDGQDLQTMGFDPSWLNYTGLMRSGPCYVLAFMPVL